MFPPGRFPFQPEVQVQEAGTGGSGPAGLHPSRMWEARRMARCSLEGVVPYQAVLPARMEAVLPGAGQADLQVPRWRLAG